MLGCYDFCAHYEWTFQWLHEQGGPALVRQYWAEAISRESQFHARELIRADGFEGMSKYWGATLLEESPDAGYHITSTPRLFRIDMLDCPSKGFLIRNGLEQYGDYCDHCIGWIGPMMKEAGFVIDHEHNHGGQCWWEMRRSDDATPPSSPGGLSAHDVRNLPGWLPENGKLDRYRRAVDPDDKAEEG